MMKPKLRLSKIKVLIIVALVLIGIVVLINVSTTQVQDNNNLSNNYKFTDLGYRCSVGATNSRNLAATLKSNNDKLVAEFQPQLDQARALSAGSSNNDTAYNNYNTASSQFSQLYLAGGMTKEEYEAKKIQLKSLLDTQLAQNATANTSVNSEINRLQADLDKRLEDNNKSIIAINSREAKLNSCATSASNKVDFSPSEVADFEALIYNSNQIPK